MAELPSTPLKTVPLGFMSVDPIYGDDDSFEVETPDFHFDWLATTNERQGARLGDETSTPAASSSASAWAKHPAPLSHKLLLGVVSQDSSPSWSASSTPPNDQPLAHRSTDLSSLPSFSGTIDTRPHASSKGQPRVVSAPLPISSGAEESEAPTHDRRDDHVSPGDHHAISRSAYATPGLTQRTLTLTSASSARRVAKPNPNLSRFGGPARRVAPQPDLNEPEELSPVNKSEPSLDSPQGRHSSDIGDGTPHQRDDVPHRPQEQADDVLPPIRRQKARHEDEHCPSPPPPPLTTSLGDNIPARADLHKTYAKSGEDVRELQFTGRDGQISPPLHERRKHQEHPQPTSHNWGQRHVVEDTGAPARERHAASREANVASELKPPLRAERSAPGARTGMSGEGTSLHSAGENAQTKATVASQTKRIFMVNSVPYERLGVLGRGGSSKVYSVLCPAKRIVYALKRVALERADAETYQSYTNEIELLRRLRGHDRIIQLIDHQITFNQGNRPKMLMMVMECGEIDFAALLDEQGGKPLNMSFVGLYWQQMLEAVQAVHAENVVHTDLKPANFVLVKGRLKIIDFGIAKAIANDTVNIQRDQQVGTVNYMSPEAIQKMNNQKVLKLSYPSDVWSLGCILYQMIYGNPPFHHISGGPLSKMNKIADPNHRIDFPSTAIPKSGVVGCKTSAIEVTVPNEAISSMRGCLEYHKDRRLTIPQLLMHDFLSSAPNSALPPGATWISKEQMAVLVAHVIKSKGTQMSPETVADDLFEQLAAQNALSS